MDDKNDAIMELDDAVKDSKKSKHKKPLHKAIDKIDIAKKAKEAVKKVGKEQRCKAKAKKAKKA